MFALVFILALAHSGPAPADEYFGPFKESILGIRNHLVDLERSNTRDLIHHRRGIDNEEMACEAWERSYPNDSWLPGFFSRIVHLYQRAHATNDAYYRTARVYLSTVQGARRQ